jgi:ribosome-binding factor A
VNKLKERTNRISVEFKKEISNIIRNELKDPRLAKLISVTWAKVTRDLRYAKVYISVMGNDEQKNSTMAALKSASGFIRREIGQRINLRYTPEIHFELDNSIEHGVYMSKLIKDTLKKDKEQSYEIK